MKIISMLLVFAVTALAQNPPRMYRMYHVDVPADSAAEFYAVQRDTAAVYKNNKAPMPRMAWTNITGEPTFHYLVPLASLDKLDDRTWLSQQGTEAARQARTARLRKATGVMRTEILTAQEELTWSPNPQAPPDKFLVVTSYSVKPGKVAEFTALLKESNEVWKKLGKVRNIFVNRVSFGGDGYEFGVAAGYDSLADVPTMAAFRTAMGNDYNAYVQKMGAAIHSLRREIVRYRPEFSYIPSN